MQFLLFFLSIHRECPEEQPKVSRDMQPHLELLKKELKLGTISSLTLKELIYFFPINLDNKKR